MKEKFKNFINLVKTNKKYKIILSLVLVVVIAIAGFFVYQHFFSDAYEDSMDISGLTKQEIQDMINQQVKDSEINVQYELNAVFKDKESESFMVRNIKANHGDIVFTVFDEDGNELYQSKKLRRGQEVRHITLKKSLPKGKYKLQIQIGYAKSGNVASVFPLNATFK